jgi:predicted amidohydrolase
MSNKIRVAAAQFHVGNDVDKNLATCLRMMRAAGEQNPDLLVLPEFANHCSWYDGAEHCFDVSVDLDGSFVNSIADCVREINAHVVINCTVRRDDKRVTGTSILFAPDGSIIGTTNKQVLIGHENDFLDRATEAGPVVETPLGRLAMYSCMDGVINETPRCLALRGAQVLCNSLNSFALDEGFLHIPVRAAENRVWVVAANKTGPLIPEELVAPVSEATKIPAHFLDGAGDSQIVAPDGTVVALAGKGEEVIIADIDPAQADNKVRPDGTDIFDARRPSLYAALGEDPTYQALTIVGPEDVKAAAVESLEEITQAQAQGAKLICLAADTVSEVDTIKALLDDDALVAAARPDGSVALVGKDGPILFQHPIHVDGGAETVNCADTVFGRVAVLCGADSIFPETMRLAALQSVSTVLIPASLLEDWEGRTGIVERAAENRVNIILASSQPGERGSLIASLQKDFTIMTEWQNREFDGLLSAPVVHRRTGNEGILVQTVHPHAAANKECSRNTHLLASRPWNLMQAMMS